MKNRAINIAVCSVVPRCGTTTTAFQMIGYLSLKGVTVAYVDMVNSDYIENLTKLYAGVQKMDTLTRYEDINMYENFTDIHTEYDYIIKDYGCMKNESFNKISFLEQDVKVICCGIKPNEIFELTDILKDKDFDNAKFAFNFVPFDQREGILEQMGSRCENSIFLSFTPDPFSYDGSNNTGFRHIIENGNEAAAVHRKSIIKSIRRWFLKIRLNWLTCLNILIFILLIICFLSLR